MNKQANEAEAARILGVANALAAQLWRGWRGTSWTDFCIGMVAVGLVCVLFWFVAGGG